MQKGGGKKGPISLGWFINEIRVEVKRRGHRKRWNPTCLSCWLTGVSFLFQLDHVSVRALLSQSSDAKQGWQQWQQENPEENSEENPEEPWPGGGVGAASNTNTFHFALNYSALHLWMTLAVEGHISMPDRYGTSTLKRNKGCHDISVTPCRHKNVLEQKQKCQKWNHDVTCPPGAAEAPSGWQL